MNTDIQQTGFLLIDKPAGWTSFDIVAKLRGITGIKKIGHAGTLDPFATGLLIVAIGKESTKQIDSFVKLTKEYEATFVLGATSPTHDPEGTIVQTGASEAKIGDIEKAIETLSGDIEQIPPMHSAIKINGRRLYKIAREGKKVEREPRSITISKFEVISYNWPELKVTIECSSGTYIRALARDLGETLEVGAHTSELRRTKIGEFSVTDSHTIENITPENWSTLLIKNATDQEKVR